jgi:hypothetical protein
MISDLGLANGRQAAAKEHGLGIWASEAFEKI